VNTDSSVNVVVFEVLIGRRLEKLLGEGPTKAADGIRLVWGELAAGFGVRPGDVRRVYAQWEPTPADRAFLAATFPPAVKVSYSFRRPAAGRDWGEGTPEFAREVEEFERVYSATGVAEVGAQRRRPRRPWWQYWDWPGEANNPFTGEPQ
jgi:hypothetical protein